MKQWHKTILVMLAAVSISTVAIQASDIFRNIEGGLAGLVVESDGPCGEGAVLINLGTGSLCIDVYEAAPSKSCPILSPNSQVETQTNINAFQCQSVSSEGLLPWRYISQTQAQQMCARAGKRLPTNDEWYSLVSSSGDQSQCVTSSDTPRKSQQTTCITQAGIYDMIGNLWEWVDEEVYEGVYNNRPLPRSGYVHMVDSNGIVLETAETAEEEYGKDYATINHTKVRGVLRGGFYGSGDDSGIYAQNISVPLNAKLPGVGFRCVKSI